MKYKWVLFDADGTLFDYDQAEATALEKTFAQTGPRFESSYIETYRQINERIWLEFEQGKISQARLRIKRFEQFLERINIEADPAKFSQRYLWHLADSSDLIEGAEETVSALYGQIGLVIITNGLQDVQRPRLAKSVISNYLADVVISEEVGAAKPDKKIFDVAFSRMGNPRQEEVLIVGDSLTSDIKGGNNYGIDTCWFNPRQRLCNLDVEILYEISHLSEIVSIVEAHG